jgi:hypothetical protein
MRIVTMRIPGVGEHALAPFTWKWGPADGPERTAEATAACTKYWESLRQERLPDRWYSQPVSEQIAYMAMRGHLTPGEAGLVLACFTKIAGDVSWLVKVVGGEFMDQD